ncbi:a-factor receptor [Ceratobasidium sp. 428]|nr:a-factor receptor [Ceratobasidium sp. 428]
MSRYFRLMALSATEMVFSLPISIYFLISALRLGPFGPWIPPWDLPRSYVLMIDFVSYEVDNEAPVRTRAGIDLNRWLVPSCAFAFFIFFGVSSEEHEGYKRGFRRVAGLFSIRRPFAKPQASTEAVDRTGPEEHTLATRQPNSLQGTKDIESQT